MSSRKRRRSPGPPLTTIRSSGENTVTRTVPNRSRTRCNFCLFTCTRLRPTACNSASISESRPSSWCTVARMIAWSAPTRINASPGCTTKARQRREVGERLCEVRLALPVVADDRRRARRQVELRGHVVPKVHQLQMRNDQDSETTEHGAQGGRSRTIGRDPDNQTRCQKTAETTRVRRRHSRRRERSEM